MTFLIAYGPTLLAADPCNLPLPEWIQLLAAFGMRNKPQLLFPLNLAGRSSVEGHIVSDSVRRGRKVSGETSPTSVAIFFEFEDLLTATRSTVVASVAVALDKNCHQRVARTDLAFPDRQKSQ